MKGCLHELLLLTLLTSCASAPAKQSASANRERNLLGRRSYAYDPPADVASGLPDHFELAGPPPAPLFPDRTKEGLPFFSPTKQTSTTTTTTTIPPPPSGLYGAPSSDTSGFEASNFNSNFVSVGLQRNKYFQGPALKATG